jgi:hypothetical protein
MEDQGLSTSRKVTEEIRFPSSSDPLIDPNKQNAVNDDKERKAHRK